MIATVNHDYFRTRFLSFGAATLHRGVHSPCPSSHQKYMASPNPAAIREAVSSAIHAYQANLSGGLGVNHLLSEEGRVN